MSDISKMHMDNLEFKYLLHRIIYFIIYKQNFKVICNNDDTFTIIKMGKNKI